MGRIQNIKPEVKEAIKRKSAFVLPDNPGASGFKPEDIRKALYKPIIDAANSALAEIDRVIDEVNRYLDDDSSVIDALKESEIREGYYEGKGGLIYQRDEDGFILCGSLTTFSGGLEIPRYVIYDDALHAVHTVREGSFSGSYITSIVASESLKTIEAEAFAGCEWLQNVLFKGKTALSSAAFPVAPIQFTVPVEYLPDYEMMLEYEGYEIKAQADDGIDNILKALELQDRINSDTRESLSELGQTTDKLEGRIDDQDVRIEERINEHNDHEGRINDHEERITELDRKCSSLDYGRGNHEIRISDNEAGIADHEERINDHEERISDNEAQIAMLKGEKGETGEDGADGPDFTDTQEYDDIIETLDDHEERISANEAGIADHLRRINDHEYRLNALEAGSCVMEGTPILMADGSTKAIEDVKYGDMIKSWDVDAGEYIDVKSYGSIRTGVARMWLVHYFSGGEILKIYTTHPIFCKETGSVKYTSTWKAGMTAIGYDGVETTFAFAPKLVESEYKGRYVLLSENNLYFAGGILCGHHSSTKIRYWSIGLFKATEEEVSSFRESAAIYDERYRLGTSPEYLRRTHDVRMRRLAAVDDRDACKRELAARDYKTIKHAQGKLSDDEQRENVARCEELRGRVGERETEIKSIMKEWDAINKEFPGVKKTRDQRFKEAYAFDMARIKERRAKEEG